MFKKNTYFQKLIFCIIMFLKKLQIKQIRKATYLPIYQHTKKISRIFAYEY